MSGEDQMSPVVQQHVELLVGMSRIEGKVDAYAANGTATAARHDDAILKILTEQSSMRDRLTALETARKASPPWHVTVGALVPTLALVLVLAQQIYGK